ncbi:MAG: hypothetical protein BAJALOKI1v1_2600003 [Promethearchaeota archaeon]|nr:MAG: hypothetical protein BAJALOKI1v1_2600003 [Candidatus Lokiarchaeota archaeon]
MNINYLDKFKGAILGLTAGDILGHPFRGKLRTEIAAEFNFFEKNKDIAAFEKFIFSNKKKFNTYTNNTQLALHLTKALIKAKGFDIREVIREFLYWLDDPPIGQCYSSLSTLKKIKKGIAWNNAASPSAGCGTLARSIPIGLYYCTSSPQLEIVAKESSLITHAHSAPSIGAVVIAKAIAYVLLKSPNSSFSVDEFFNTIASSISNLSDVDKTIKEEYIDNFYKIMLNLTISEEAGLIKFSQIGVKSPYFIEDYLGKAFVHPYALSTVICSLFLFLKNVQKHASFKEYLFSFITTGAGSTFGALGGAITGAYFGYLGIPKNFLRFIKDKKTILAIVENLYQTFETHFLKKNCKY